MKAESASTYRQQVPIKGDDTMKNELRRHGDRDYDFFDEAMHDFFPSIFGTSHHTQRYMRTDIKENDNGYVLEVEMPGVNKQDIDIDLKDGYLNISVSKSEKNDGDKKDNYIHRERSFSCSRSYYVGDIDKSEIKAKYDNGILTVEVPKDSPKKPENRIEIE